MPEKYLVSRRAALAGVLASTGVSTAVTSAAKGPQSFKQARKIFQTGRKIRERAGREAMIRYWEARGLNLADSSTASRSLRGQDDVSIQKAETTDCDLTCNIVQVYGYDQLFADTKMEIIKNTETPLGGDNGEPPYDVLSIGWETSDYDAYTVGNAEPGNPEWGGAAVEVDTNTSSGIAWLVEDAGKGDVDEGEVVWSATASCELIPEDGTDVSERKIRSAYMHSWKGSTSGDQASVSFGPNGDISVSYQVSGDETIERWSSPVEAFAQE